MERLVLFVECAPKLVGEFSELAPRAEIAMLPARHVLPDEGASLLVLGESVPDRLGLVGRLARGPGSASTVLLTRASALAELELRVQRELPPASLGAVSCLVESHDTAQHLATLLRTATKPEASRPSTSGAEGVDWLAGSQARHELFNALVSSREVAMLGHDSQGIVTLWNRGAEVLSGNAARAALGRPLTAMLHQSSHAEVDGFMATLARGILLHGVPVRFLTSEGAELPVSVSMCPVRGHQGSIAGACWIVSELSQLSCERELSRQRSDELQDFVHTVSHDLRAPLITLLGFVGLLRSDVEESDVMLSDSANLSLARIETSAARLKRMFDDLLLLSRVGAAPNSSEVVSIDSLVRELVSDLELEFKQHSVHWQLQTLPSALVESSRAHQIFYQVLRNAVEHGASKVRAGEVTIRASHSGNGVEYVVEDNGPGLSESQVEGAFDLFRKFDSRAPGSGAGLCLAKRAAQALGGKLSLASHVGEYTRVSVWLPRG